MDAAHAVERIAAHITRATQLVDQGDAFGADPVASMRLASLALRMWSLTTESISPDMHETAVQDQTTVAGSLRAALDELTACDLTELQPSAVAFLLDLRDLVDEADEA